MAHTPSLGIGCTGDLKEKISEEEKSAEERGAGVADMECLCQPGCRTETVVCSIEIGKTVGDKDRRQDDEPAPAHLRLCSECVVEQFSGRLLHSGFHCAIIIVAERPAVGDDGAFVVLALIDGIERR